MLRSRYRVLGPVELMSQDGVEIPTRSRRLRALLAVLLAANGRTVSKAQVVDAVWGLDTPAHPDGAIHTQVSRLRRFLPDDALITKASGYVLRADVDDVDATRFQALVVQAGLVRPDDPERALDLLNEAIGLWTGPAYEDFAQHPHFVTEIKRLHELELTAREEAFDVLDELGRAPQAISEMDQHVRENPLRDRAVDLLMRTLYHVGRQNDALEVYSRHRQVLVREVGIEPSHRLKRLERDILAQDVAPAAAARTRSATVRAAGTQPSAGTAFVGRVRELNRLRELVSSGRLVTVLGPGGVGKSRLVAEFASNDDDIVRAVRTVELCKITEPDGVTRAIADIVGRDLPVKDPNGIDLLVLDNCEHLLDEVRAVVRDVLESGQGMRIVATSRTRLGLPGERVVDVGPLPLPSHDRVSDAIASPAVALLMDRMSAVRELEITDATVTDIVRLCRMVDGVPLALEIIAPYIRGMTAADLAAELGERLDSANRTPGLHESLASVVEWSYELLTPEQRKVFRALAVFSGQFSIAAVAAVCGLSGVDAGRVAAELVDHSLIMLSRCGERTCYTMLTVVRQYAWDRLDESGERELTAERLAGYYARLATTQITRSRPWPDDELVETLAVFDDYRSAAAWFLEHDEWPDRAFAILAMLWSVHQSCVRGRRDSAERSHYAIAREVAVLAERTLDRWRAFRHPLITQVAATAAAGHLVLGDVGLARARAQEAIDSEGIPGASPALHARRTLAHVAHLHDGDHATAASWTREAREHARHTGDRWLVAELDVLLASIVAATGDTDEAIRVTEGVCRAAAEMGHSYLVAWGRIQLGMLYLPAAVTRAEVILDLALADARRLGYTYGIGSAVRALAMMSVCAGRLGDAARLSAVALKHYRGEGERLQLVHYLASVIPLLVAAGDHRSAATVLGAVEHTGFPICSMPGARLIETAVHALAESIDADLLDALRSRGSLLGSQEIVRDVAAWLDDMTRVFEPSGWHSSQVFADTDDT